MDNETGSGRHLRDLLNISPDGRKIFVWSGTNRKADTDELTRAIAGIGELFDQQGRIVRLDGDGELVGINLAGLHKFIDQHICGMRVVRKGALATRLPHLRVSSGTAARCLSQRAAAGS